MYRGAILPEVSEALVLLERGTEMTVRVLRDAAGLNLMLVKELIGRHRRDGQVPIREFPERSARSAFAVTEKSLPNFRKTAGKKDLTYAVTDNALQGHHSIVTRAEEKETAAQILQETDGRVPQETVPGDIDRGIFTAEDTYQPLCRMDLEEKSAAEFLARADEAGLAAASLGAAQMLKDDELQYEAIAAIVKHAAGRNEEELAAIERNWPKIRQDAKLLARRTDRQLTQHELKECPAVPIPDGSGTLLVFRAEHREELAKIPGEDRVLVRKEVCEERLRKLQPPDKTAVLLMAREREKAERILQEQKIPFPGMREVARSDVCWENLEDHLLKLRNEREMQDKYWCITLAPHEAAALRMALDRAGIEHVRVPGTGSAQFILRDESRVRTGNILQKLRSRASLRRAETPEVASGRRISPAFFKHHPAAPGKPSPVPGREHTR